MIYNNLKSFILLVLISLITFAFVSSKYERYYKVNDMGHHLGNKVTEFKVKTNEKQLGLFNNSFDVDVTLKGTCFDSNYYVDYVQRAEYTKVVDGKLVAFVEFVPVFNAALIFPYNNNGRFETKFKHTLNGYEYGPLVYIFRCGDFEESVYINGGF